MERFFVHVNDVVQLILSDFQDQQHRDRLIFNVESPTPIIHLAEILLLLNGYASSSSKITLKNSTSDFEKLSEVLFDPLELVENTNHPNVKRIAFNQTTTSFNVNLDSITDLINCGVKLDFNTLMSTFYPNS